MDLAELRSHWNEVLNELEMQDRIAWLVYFDARLSDFDGKNLILDFSDSEKFAHGIGFTSSRDRHKAILVSAIMTVCGIKVEIIDQ